MDRDREFRTATETKRLEKESFGKAAEDMRFGPACEAEPSTDFGWVIHQLKMGLKVFRKNWNGKGLYICLQKPDSGSKMSRPYIYIRTAQNDLVPWCPSHGDLLGTDWEIFK